MTREKTGLQPAAEVRSGRAVAAYPGKRAFDLVTGATLLLITSPLLLLCALAVRLGSRGPVLFGHRRYGKDGEPFECLKFRTMVSDAEEWLERDPELRRRHRRNGFKLPTDEDPRVTATGRFLRRTHLDELPQLINVLRGEMSLVGPRPIVEEELAHYGERAANLLSVRPGVFGPWTALGRKRPDYPERCEVELSYVRRASFLRDVWLLLRNIVVVARGQ